MREVVLRPVLPPESSPFGIPPRIWWEGHTTVSGGRFASAVGPTKYLALERLRSKVIYLEEPEEQETVEVDW